MELKHAGVTRRWPVPSNPVSRSCEVQGGSVEVRSCDWRCPEEGWRAATTAIAIAVTAVGKNSSYECYTEQPVSGAAGGGRVYTAKALEDARRSSM